MLFIVLWAMFSFSQAYAACCGPHGGQWHGRGGSAAAHSMEAIADTDHGKSQELPCGDPDAPSCPTTLEDVTPLVAFHAAPGDSGNFPRVLAPPVRSAAPEPVAHLWFGQEIVCLSLPPPEPIYLRLQRFLI